MYSCILSTESRLYVHWRQLWLLQVAGLLFEEPPTMNVWQRLLDRKNTAPPSTLAGKRNVCFASRTVLAVGGLRLACE